MAFTPTDEQRAILAHDPNRLARILANYVIQGDPNRPADRGALNPAANAPEGDVGLFSYKSERAEAKGIAELVVNVIAKEKLDPTEVLILLRSDYNGQFSRAIKEALTDKKIPFSDPSTVNELMKEASTREMLTTVRFGRSQKISRSKKATASE